MVLINDSRGETNMKELISKFQIGIVMKDGQKMLGVKGKPNATETEKIKSNKQLIIETIENESKAREIREKELIEKRAKEFEENEAKIDSLIQSGEAKLCLLFGGDFLSDVSVSYVVMASDEDLKGYASWFIEGNKGRIHKQVRSVYKNDKIFKVLIEMNFEAENNGISFSQSSVKYITQEQFETIKKAVEDKEKAINDEIEARKQAKTEARNAIFAKAKETGEKQLLSKWSEPCNDPKEECDIDMLHEYALPDGSTKITRSHTW